MQRGSRGARTSARSRSLRDCAPAALGARWGRPRAAVQRQLRVQERGLWRSKERCMLSAELRAALSAHLEAAAAHLQAELDGGAEVPFELERHGGRRGSRPPALCTATAR